MKTDSCLRSLLMAPQERLVRVVWTCQVWNLCLLFSLNRNLVPNLKDGNLFLNSVGHSTSDKWSDAAPNWNCCVRGEQYSPCGKSCEVICYWNIKHISLTLLLDSFCTRFLHINLYHHYYNSHKISAMSKVTSSNINNNLDLTAECLVHSALLPCTKFLSQWVCYSPAKYSILSV